MFCSFHAKALFFLREMLSHSMPSILLIVSPIGYLHCKFLRLEALLFSGEGPSGGVFGSLRSRAIRATRVEPYMVMEQRERRDGLLRRLLQPDMERLAVQKNYFSPSKL